MKVPEDYGDDPAEDHKIEVARITSIIEKPTIEFNWPNS